MKGKKDERLSLIFRYALLVLAGGLILLGLLLHFEGTKNILSAFLGACKPLLYALLFVLFVAGPTQAVRRILEKRMCKNGKRKKLCGVLSVLLGYLFFIVIIAALLVLVILPLIVSYSSFAQDIPAKIEGAKEWISATVSSIPFLSMRADSIIEHIGNSLNLTFDTLAAFAPVAITAMRRVLSEASSIFLGLIISVYIIASLSYLNELRAKILTSLFSKENAERIHRSFEDAYLIFRDYFAGRLLYSLIVGIVFYIILWSIGIPLYSFISIMIGVCVFVPVAGTVVGFLIGMFLVVITDAPMAIWFALLYIVLLIPGYLFLQRYIIRRHVRPAITESILAVLVMQGFFGVGGSIVAVPVYLWIRLQTKKYLAYRERKRLHAHDAPDEQDGDIPPKAAEKPDENGTAPDHK